MSGFLRQSVRLVGGRCDGRVVEVSPLKLVHTEIVSETPHTYPPGTFGDPDGPAVTVTRIEIETYRRDGDSLVFRPYWTQTSIGDFASTLVEREAV